LRKIFPGNEKKAGVTGDSLLSAAMTALVDEPVTARLSFNNIRKSIERLQQMYHDAMLAK